MAENVKEKPMTKELAVDAVVTEHALAEVGLSGFGLTEKGSSPVTATSASVTGIQRGIATALGDFAALSAVAIASSGLKARVKGNKGKEEEEKEEEKKKKKKKKKTVGGGSKKKLVLGFSPERLPLSLRKKPPTAYASFRTELSLVLTAQGVASSRRQSIISNQWKQMPTEERKRREAGAR